VSLILRPPTFRPKPLIEFPNFQQMPKEAAQMFKFCTAPLTNPFKVISCHCGNVIETQTEHKVQAQTNISQNAISTVESGKRRQIVSKLDADSTCLDFLYFFSFARHNSWHFSSYFASGRRRRGKLFPCLCCGC